MEVPSIKILSTMTRGWRAAEETTSLLRLGSRTPLYFAPIHDDGIRALMRPAWIMECAEYYLYREG